MRRTELLSDRTHFADAKDGGADWKAHSGLTNVV